MGKIDIGSRTIGVNFDPTGRCRVLLWAPMAKSAAIFLTSENRTIPMIAESYGYWSLQTDEIRPGTEYYFRVDGEQFPDPASMFQPDGVHGASEAIDIHAFTWSDQQWNGLALKDYIIYELHTGTFTPDGTFAAIEKKLDYLLELGITAIEIMPVVQFSGGRNWGYDGVFPFSVQNSYGGATGLQSLVNACHQKGMAVILDVVFNHIGPEGNHLESFGPYFTDKYHTPWGNAINFDDAWCDGVRQFYIDNALMWFRDFHVDALRMDAVHAIKDFSTVHILQEIRQQTALLMQQTGRIHYLIAELDLNDTRYINPIKKGGYGLDAQWIDEFHHALRVTSGQPRTGYYADFNGIESLAKSYEDAYVYDGAYSEHRKKRFGMTASENPGEQFVVFSQNHDHVGNRMLGERTSQLVSYEMQKLLAGAVLVSPYIPMLFMGEEYAEVNPFQYFVSHTDPELADAVRRGRKAEFEAFHMDGEAPDPLSEETFKNSVLNWNALENQPHKTMLNFYKEMIAIRKKQAPLHVLNRKELTVECNPEQQTIVLQRRYKLDDVICLMNFSKQPHKISVPVYAPLWHKLIASADIIWGGSEDLPDSYSGDLSLSLPAESFTLYTNHYE